MNWYQCDGEEEGSFLQKFYVIYNTTSTTMYREPVSSKSIEAFHSPYENSVLIENPSILFVLFLLDLTGLTSTPDHEEKSIF